MTPAHTRAYNSSVQSTTVSAHTAHLPVCRDIRSVNNVNDIVLFTYEKKNYTMADIRFYEEGPIVERKMRTGCSSWGTGSLRSPSQPARGL